MRRYGSKHCEQRLLGEVRVVEDEYVGRLDLRVGVEVGPVVHDADDLSILVDREVRRGVVPAGEPDSIDAGKVRGLGEYLVGELVVAGQVGDTSCLFEGVVGDEQRDQGLAVTGGQFDGDVGASIMSAYAGQGGRLRVAQLCATGACEVFAGARRSWSCTSGARWSGSEMA